MPKYECLKTAAGKFNFQSGDVRTFTSSEAKELLEDTAIALIEDGKPKIVEPKPKAKPDTEKDK